MTNWYSLRILFFLSFSFLFLFLQWPTDIHCAFYFLFCVLWLSQNRMIIIPFLFLCVCSIGNNNHLPIPISTNECFFDRFLPISVLLICSIHRNIGILFSCSSLFAMIKFMLLHWLLFSLSSDIANSSYFHCRLHSISISGTFIF